MIAKLWAQQIMVGNKSFTQVPHILKKDVEEILKKEGRKDLIK